MMIENKRLIFLPFYYSVLLLDFEQSNQSRPTARGLPYWNLFRFVWLINLLAFNFLLANATEDRHKL